MSNLKKAPDFTLPDQNGNVRTLEEFRGRWVVLYFYPKDDTPGCTAEACGFRDARESIAALGNAEVVGISRESVSRHKKFAEKYGLTFTLLSDTAAEVIQAYGAWQEKSMFGKKYMGIQRMTLLINPDGQITKVYPKVNPVRHAAEIIRDLQALQA